MKKEIVLMGLLGLTACSNSDTVSSTETSDLEVFYHPVFSGFSEICLPYIKTASHEKDFSDKDAITIIETLTQSAGFKKGEFSGVHHRNSNTIYSVGNKAYGAEIEATYSNFTSNSVGGTKGRYCSSSFRYASDYPSLENFEKWLNVQDPAWVLRADRSVDRDAGKAISITFCKTDQSGFGQRLFYTIFDRKFEPKRDITMSISIQILEDRPCIR